MDNISSVNNTLSEKAEAVSPVCSPLGAPVEEPPTPVQEFEDVSQLLCSLSENPSPPSEREPAFERVEISSFLNRLSPPSPLINIFPAIRKWLLEAEDLIAKLRGDIRADSKYENVAAHKITCEQLLFDCCTRESILTSRAPPFYVKKEYSILFSHNYSFRRLLGLYLQELNGEVVRSIVYLDLAEYPWHTVPSSSSLLGPEESIVVCVTPPARLSLASAGVNLFSRKGKAFPAPVPLNFSDALVQRAVIPPFSYDTERVVSDPVTFGVAVSTTYMPTGESYGVGKKRSRDFLTKYVLKIEDMLIASPIIIHSSASSPVEIKRSLYVNRFPTDFLTPNITNKVVQDLKDHFALLFCRKLPLSRGLGDVEARGILKIIFPRGVMSMGDFVANAPKYFALLTLLESSPHLLALWDQRLLQGFLAQDDANKYLQCGLSDCAFLLFAGETRIRIAYRRNNALGDMVIDLATLPDRNLARFCMEKKTGYFPSSLMILDRTATNRYVCKMDILQDHSK